MAPSPMSGAFRPADRIVVPVQGTDREFIAQQWAVEFAAALGVPICALHVTTAGKAPDNGVFSFLEEACMKWGVTFHKQILAGEDVVDELVHEIKTRDLVIIGTRRLSGHYHVGSITRDLVKRVHCPVQVVRIE